MFYESIKITCPEAVGKKKAEPLVLPYPSIRENCYLRVYSLAR